MKKLKRAFAALDKRGLESEPLAAAEADAEFHMTIAEASHNVALSHIVKGLFNSLRKSVYYSRFVLIREHGENQKMIHGQHRAILEAISAHDSEAARAAANLHLNFLLATIRETKNKVDLTQVRAAEVHPRQAQRSKAAKTRSKDAD